MLRVAPTAQSLRQEYAMLQIENKNSIQSIGKREKIDRRNIAAFFPRVDAEDGLKIRVHLHPDLQAAAMSR